MKVIAFNRRPDMPVMMPPAVDLIADSAIVPAGRPVFLPDFAEGWTARLYVAYRMSRLGKSIAANFASRYYDALTVALRLLPSGFEGGGVGSLFDYALALGTWMPLPADTATPLKVTCGDISVSLSRDEVAADTAIAAASTYATLKTGDIIMPCLLPAETTVAVGDDVSATLGEEQCLNVRVR